MRRRIASLSNWWLRLFVLSIPAALALRTPWWVEIPLWVALLGLASIRAPWDRNRASEAVSVPVAGRWVAINSPATKVPSHGTLQFGQTYAIDILVPRAEPARLGWGVGMRRPEGFAAFGRPVHAVADGVVVRAVDGQRDHRSRESYPAVAYLMLIEGFVRLMGGTRFVTGNHVIVDHGGGVYAAYAHLHRGSVGVAPGDRVRTGDVIGEVGNSGNTTEPHLHFQLMDDPRPTAAAGVPFRWRGVEVTGETDLSWLKEVSEQVVPGLPGNGQVFVAEPARAGRASDEPASRPGR